MKLSIDKVASAAKNIPISREVEVSNKIISKEGYLIALRALEEKSIYGDIELVNGKLSKIVQGDIIVGVLGERRALRGFKGKVPKSLEVGDTVHILNLGGIVGKCTSRNSIYGSALKTEVLGSIVNSGKPVNIKKNSIKWNENVKNLPPIVLISGTCMDTGKTTVACTIILGLKNDGYKVAAAKLTGISCLKDVNKMIDHGAIKSLIFTDAGIASTTNNNNILLAAKGILLELNEVKPDVIVIELGDGILGEYCVGKILQDRDIMSSVKLNVLCANDPVGVYGGKVLFERMNLNIGIICGPVTDNDVGVDYIEKKLGIPAVNAVYNPKKLNDIVRKVIQSAS